MSVIGVILKRKIFSKIAFGCFLLTVPLSVRKVLFIFSPDGSGLFNEYTDISLYLSDLTLLLFLLAIVLENKERILSIKKLQSLFHVEQSNFPILAPLPFLCWAGLSILWSESRMLGFFALFKLLEGYFLYVAMIISLVPRGTNDALSAECSTWNNEKTKIFSNNLFHVEQIKMSTDGIFNKLKIVPRGTMRNFLIWIKENCSTWNIWGILFYLVIFIGVSQGILAIAQFIFQSSIGINFLRESIFSASQPGIAKIIIGEGVFVRSYGLFPHPNILAVFLGISILFTISAPLIFSRNLFHVEQLLIAYRTALFIQGFGFLVTFSKSAFFGFLMAIFYYIFRLFHVEQPKNKVKDLVIVPRGTITHTKNYFYSYCSTWNNKNFMQIFRLNLFHVEQRKNLFLIGLLFFLSVLFFSSVNWHYFFFQPLEERNFISQEFLSIISQNTIGGVGIGQSVLLMQNYFNEKLLSWQFQPIHSLFLLILIETGVVGFGLWILFFMMLARILFRKNVPRGTQKERAVTTLIVSMSLFMAIVSFFDHYFWDIQQGQLLLWLLFGVVASKMK